jgi:hypothetical protein
MDPSAITVFPVETSHTFEENSESVYLQILAIYHKRAPVRSRIPHRGSHQILGRKRASFLGVTEALS